MPSIMIWTVSFRIYIFVGLVRNAGSIALTRSRKDGSGIDGLLITLDDVMNALEEIKA